MLEKHKQVIKWTQNGLHVKIAVNAQENRFSKEIILLFIGADACKDEITKQWQNDSSNVQYQGTNQGTEYTKQQIKVSSLKCQKSPIFNQRILTFMRHLAP